MSIEVWVSGVPTPQPRAKASSRGGHVRMYTPSTFISKKNGIEQRVTHPIVAWKNALRDALRPVAPSVPWEGPVRVDLTFIMPRPQALMRKKDPDAPIYCGRKPDRDNLDKVVLDVLTELKFWLDDGQAAAGEISKLYHAKTSGEPGARIRLTPLAEAALGRVAMEI